MTKEEEREALILFLHLAEPQILPENGDERFRRAQADEGAREKDKASTLYKDLGKIIEHVKKSSLSIKINKKTLRQNFRTTIERRLSALLVVYGCDATPKGWRKLAIALAMKTTLDGVPIMDVRVPPKERDVRGRERSKDHQGWFEKIEKHIKETGKTARGAAYHLTGFREGTNYKYNKNAEINGITPESLWVMYSKMKNKYKQIDRNYFSSFGFEFLLNKDIRAAADTLEAEAIQRHVEFENKLSRRRERMTLASIKKIKGRSTANRFAQKRSKRII